MLKETKTLAELYRDRDLEGWRTRYALIDKWYHEGSEIRHMSWLDVMRSRDDELIRKHSRYEVAVKELRELLPLIRALRMRRFGQLLRNEI